MTEMYLRQATSSYVGGYIEVDEFEELVGAILGGTYVPPVVAILKEAWSHYSVAAAATTAASSDE